MPAKGKVSFNFYVGLQPALSHTLLLKLYRILIKGIAFMRISVNNNVVELAGEQPTLANLMQRLQFGDKKGIAVAIQDQIIPKSTWPNYTLQENDKVTIIQATQGG